MGLAENQVKLKTFKKCLQDGAKVAFTFQEIVNRTSILKSFLMD